MSDFKAEIGYDQLSTLGANMAHVLYMFEGYRAAVQGGDEQTYSPSSARDTSFQMGWKMAPADLERLNAAAERFRNGNEGERPEVPPGDD
mgnify:FL=1